MTDLRSRVAHTRFRRASGKLVERSSPDLQTKDAVFKGPANVVISRQWWEKYILGLRLTDSVIITVVLLLAYVWRFGSSSSDPARELSQLSYLWAAAAIGILWIMDLDICRSRDRKVIGSGALEYKLVIQSTVRVFGSIAILLVILNVGIVRGYFAVTLPVGLALLLAHRWIRRHLLAKRRRRGLDMTKAIILGNSADVSYVIDQLGKNLDVGYVVAGVALTRSDDTENAVLLPRGAVSIPTQNLQESIVQTGAQAVVVAGPIPGGSLTIQKLGWSLEATSTQLVLASSLTNIAGPRVHFRPVEGLPLMHVELPQYTGGKHVFKRLFDVVLSSIALLILSPILLTLAIIVRMDSNGPAFFSQDRVGRNGETFKMYKFRSMIVNAEEQLAVLQKENEGSGVLFKMAHDPRVTRSGRWMRKYSLDELPQFLNVLRGNMSLVGPRPPLHSEVAQYEQHTGRRLLIKPGITGLWQVSGRSDLDWEEAVRLDLYYVENWSVAGDFMILWRTFKAVYEPSGAY